MGIQNGGQIAKDYFLTLLKSRLALGSQGWLVGCHHAENGLIYRNMVVDCPIPVTRVSNGWRRVVFDIIDIIN